MSMCRNKKKRIGGPRSQVSASSIGNSKCKSRRMREIHQRDKRLLKTICTPSYLPVIKPQNLFNEDIIFPAETTPI